ncbi:MAG: diguanylate cyclase, partial [Gammaproteobacteria bacterium]
MNIRTKLLMLFISICVVLAAISFYSLNFYKKSLEQSSSILNKVNLAVEDAHKVENLLNTQLNAWKNMLLRSHQQKDYHHYLQKFYQIERQTKQTINILKDHSREIDITHNDTEDLQVLHKKIGKQFRKALRVFNNSDQNASVVADNFMSDLEDKPVELISQIKSELLDYRDIRLKQANDERLEEEILLTATLISALFVSLIVYFFLIDTNVAKPAERASQLAEVIQTAEQIAKFGTWDWDSKTDRHYWSEGMYNILGINAEEQQPSNSSFLNALHEDDRERVKKTLSRAIQDQSLFEVEARVRMPENRERVFQQRGQVRTNPKNGNIRMTSIIYDITERKESEKRLAYLANYDTLTNLPNRHLFKDRLDHAIAQAERLGSEVAIIYLDLDHFKSVNDALGHHAGDQLLIKAATRIKKFIRSSDTAARLGGDEFIILIDQFENSSQIAAVAKHILFQLNRVFYIEGNEIFVSASMGITMFPSDGNNYETLLKNADSAMYMAKEDGRNSYHFFTEELNRIAQDKLKLENGLRMALERDEFELYYQPQVELETGRVIAAEALLRWLPNQNMVSPARFIPVLEETGLIVDVGEWVLNEACKTVKAIHSSGFDTFRIAVNLSARQLRQADLPQTISNILGKHEIDARFIEIELTESTLIDERISKTNLEKLERLGVNLAIDDFGTGYSSLSYLKRYEVDILKIDQNFIADINVDKDDDAVTSA